jgi:hypothetical protein
VEGLLEKEAAWRGIWKSRYFMLDMTTRKLHHHKRHHKDGQISKKGHLDLHEFQVLSPVETSSTGDPKSFLIVLEPRQSAAPRQQKVRQSAVAMLNTSGPSTQRRTYRLSASTQAEHSMWLDALKQATDDDSNQWALEVRVDVLQACRLRKSVGSGLPPDCHCEVVVGEDRQKTAAVPSSCHPVFSFRSKFMPNLTTHFANVDLYDKGRNEFLGSVTIPLATVQPLDHSTKRWYRLMWRDGAADNKGMRGHICLSVSSNYRSIMTSMHPNGFPLDTEMRLWARQKRINLATSTSSATSPCSPDLAVSADSKQEDVPGADETLELVVRNTTCALNSSIHLLVGTLVLTNVRLFFIKDTEGTVEEDLGEQPGVGSHQGMITCSF